MNTEWKTGAKARWTLPLLVALPFLVALAFVVIRFGPDLIQLINVAIKTAVVS